MAIIHIHGTSIFFCIFPLIILVTSSNFESEALSKLKESFTNAASLDSWKPEIDPCAGWVGVLCENGLVSGLRLAKMGLSGKIDVDALTHLSALRSVVLKLNAFSGPIPDFYKLRALKGLYISDNQFSGEISSDYFSGMKGLKKVWLSGNNFSGRVPSSLARLSQLMELHLENNKFSGAIPSFEQQSLVSLNLSNNELEGEIPPSLSRFSVHAFAGNPRLCGGNSGRACEQVRAPSKMPEKDKRLAVVFWVVVAFAVLLSAIVCLICVMRRRRRNVANTRDDERVQQDINNPVVRDSSSRKKDVSSTRKGSGSGNHRVAGPSRKESRRGNDLTVINDEKGFFGMTDLLKAAAEVLGNGTLGSSYKASMESGLTVVVKKVRETNRLEKDEFELEMRRFGSLKHKNVLPPLAYFYRKEEKLIVHEYQQKGSLLLLLHGMNQYLRGIWIVRCAEQTIQIHRGVFVSELAKRDLCKLNSKILTYNTGFLTRLTSLGDRRISPDELNWPIRLKMIQGIVRGLDFLHTELSSLQLPHGDLKSSNVLLSEDYEPLLSDFGYCSFMDESQARHSQLAYKSPESILHNQISPKCDVYFLGIIILEILTRKFPSQYLHNEQGGTDLVQWIRSAIAEGREVELLDPDITSAPDFMEEMRRFLHIGAACTEDEPDKRLGLREVVSRVGGTSGSDQETRTFHVLPSLRDGYADSSNQHCDSRVVENHNARSMSSEESIDQQSGSKSFVFQVS
ncbi:hypothetical protein ACS0TY_035469 [Phlomoides rotata]